MSQEQIDTEAARLDGAEQARTQVKQSTELFPDMTIDDAYQVQKAWEQIKLARGERLIGHKIGLTSKAMQAVMNIDTPDSGFLTNAMVYEDGAEIEAAAFSDGQIETELAFVLSDDLDSPDVTLFDVLNATDYVVPALELIAARTFRTDPDTGRTRTVVDTIADNAANGAIIMGGRPVKPNDVDLRWVGALLSRNGSIEESGVAAAVLNHPARGIVWLARRYAEQGMTLRKGQIILAGSFTRPVRLSAGDVFHADYGALGAFSINFT